MIIIILWYNSIYTSWCCVHTCA